MFRAKKLGQLTNELTRTQTYIRTKYVRDGTGGHFDIRNVKIENRLARQDSEFDNTAKSIVGEVCVHCVARFNSFVDGIVLNAEQFGGDAKWLEEITPTIGQFAGFA